ncbi:hypothetical protein EMM73_04395 [Rheinheimera sediminis]|uniref:hypothetical protein n=1 Tax=Rheinheimera sp. YQF-1 TaxID=2499626 RepID=UPI000FDB1917|nr:hypothetical protein [Rheinheimera sp. YQF-1]RVT47521.1 hypothetical protein EMM73_04395 [Rheinheimera sp. YQF-1]
MIWNKDIKFAVLLSIAASFSFFFIYSGNVYAQVAVGSVAFVIVSMLFFYKKNEDLTTLGNVKCFLFKLLLSSSVAIPLVFLTVWLSYYLGG